VRARSFATLLLGVLLALAGVRDTHAVQFLIATFGDSITVGYPYSHRLVSNGCSPPCGGYQPMLQAQLMVAGKDVLLRSYGVRGESSTAGAQRIVSVLDRDRPQFILLLEGTNDLLFTSPNTVYRNMAYMVDAALARSVVPILGTILPDIYDAVQHLSKPIVATNILLTQLARERNIDLADHYAALAGNWPSLTYDGLHPNMGGYTVMARTWFTLVNDQINAMTRLPWLLLLLD
jgi:lysophospholipase L1-like esterase